MRASSQYASSGPTRSGRRRPSASTTTHDFQPTDRRVLFGHHFAAIAGAGPLVGPVLAAQMGYLPGTIWIVVGVIFAGAVQDMVVLFFSMRRDGKSLGQMARDEIGPGRRRRGADRGAVDHGHPARGARAGRRQRAGELAVGHVHASR